MVLYFVIYEWILYSIIIIVIIICCTIFIILRKPKLRSIYICL